jgi:hypothetical protein
MHLSIVTAVNRIFIMHRPPLSHGFGGTPCAPLSRHQQRGAHGVTRSATALTARRRLHRAVATIAMTGALSAAHAPGQESRPTNAPIPLIVMEDVPLSDAIKNLARQAGINFILDPQLSDFSTGPERKSRSVSGKWENTSAEEALGAVVKQHDLVMVESPATSVTRIAPRDKEIKPVPASSVGAKTNGTIPVIMMDMVPLDQAIQSLARQAGLEITLDPRLSRPSFQSDGRLIPEPMVSVRWQNITARQALAALMDNFDLVMVEDAASGVSKITVKESAGEKPEPGKKEKRD